MDVRCSRCGTEYDFDDALVSERGTTVKCTNCGHQFKVFTGGASGAPERWVVRKSSGRELVYTSLRELQRAIAQRQVGPGDFLSRGASQPLRPLASIAELEPFFLAQGPAPAPAPADQGKRTLVGLSAGSAGPPSEDTVPDQAPMDDPPTRRPLRPPPQPVRSAPPPPAPVSRQADLEPRTLPRNEAPLVPAEPVDAEEHEPRTLGSFPPGGLPRAPTINGPDRMGAAFRNTHESFSDELLPSVGTPGRTRTLRWVVGLVLLAGVAFVGSTLGARYLESVRTAKAPAPAAPDDRVGKLLEQGDADLARGDYESAKEQLYKASALAEKDVTVLAAIARLEATEADVHWLSVRLADPADTQAIESATTELSQRVDRVKRATAAAEGVAASDKAVIRVRIDTLRLAGDVAGARALVGALGLDASQPETAYVLGALDLADENPTLGTATDRLRTGASTERGFGRARAALVYALGSAGTVDEAKAELAKLEAAAPRHPLVQRLKAFLERRSAAPAGSAEPTPEPAPEPAPAASAEPPAAAVVPAAGTPAPAAAAGRESIPRGLDFRRLLEDASAAKRGGDLGRAEALYRAAESQQPGNVEALAGMGDVARLRGDTATASSYYDSALRQNPTYLPALTAAADLKWQSGDRAGALVLYKRVANQTDPGSPYGQKAAARILESQGGGGAAPAAATVASPPPASTPESPPAPPPAPAPEAPHIDTSDLPGFK